MTNMIYGGYANSSNTYSLTLNSDGQVASTPKGLIATSAAQTKAGWLGQVYVDKTIVHETEPQTESEVAMRLANEYVVARVTALFSEGV